MTPAPPRTRYCSRCLTTFVEDPDRCTNLGCRGGRPAGGWGELMDTGDLIDRTYRIHKRLAIGGAGVTYLGRETKEDGTEFGPLLAVKVLYQQRDQGPYLRRLATEAQIIQGLNHPQIVEYRGFVHRSGQSPYLVTRFEQGGSLLDHLRANGQLPVQSVANIGRQVCWALEVAHRQGVVHRDLKPENVLLVKPVGREVVPELKVADFGIAKVFGGFGDRLTRVGAFVGTPQYAAPEQFDGLTPEPAADVYAVGAMMHFCLTLRPVVDFPDQIDMETCREVLVKGLPPRLELPDAPPQLRRWMEDTLGWAMAVEPTDRCDVSTLDERLAAIAAGRDPGPVRRAATPSSDPSLLRPTSTADLAATAPASPPGPPAARASRPPPRVGGSAGGLTVEPAAPPPPPPRRADAPGQRTTTQIGVAGPTRTLTLDQLPDASTRTVGCGVLGLLALAGTAVAALALWWFLAVDHTPVRVLTDTETDPVRKQDWLGVAGTLGQVGVAAETVCQATNPNARNLQVSVTVNPDGSVRRVDLPNYAHEPTRTCMEQNLGKTRFPRAGKDVVSVSVQLPR